VGKEEQIKTDIFQSAIDYVRENHAEAIDKAYDYFWDDQKIDEMIGGVALELGFINFEDWLIFDCKANEACESFLSVFSRSRQFGPEETAVVDNIRNSTLSLYEVISVSRDKHVKLKDLLLGDEYTLRDKNLTKGLKKGDIFATRILNLDGNYVMSGCVYPYSADQKESVIKKVELQFGRYQRNVKKDGTMRDFLKDYGDLFNLIWMSYILGPGSMDDCVPAEYPGNQV